MSSRKPRPRVSAVNGVELGNLVKGWLMVSHFGHPNPPEFPVDECRRVLMECDIRASGWTLEEARLIEELRLLAITDRDRA